MPEQPLCTKCHGEPRVLGQRWGLACRAAAEAARRAKVPHETRGTVSRREQRAKLDAWLKSIRARLNTESSTAIAIAAKKEGLFSERTGVGDIRLSLFKRCHVLGLPQPCGTHPAAMRMNAGLRIIPGTLQ